MRASKLGARNMGAAAMLMGGLARSVRHSRPANSGANPLPSQESILAGIRQAAGLSLLLVQNRSIYH